MLNVINNILQTNLYYMYICIHHRIVSKYCVVNNTNILASAAFLAGAETERERDL